MNIYIIHNTGCQAPKYLGFRTSKKIGPFLAWTLSKLKELLKTILFLDTLH